MRATPSVTRYLIAAGLCATRGAGAADAGGCVAVEPDAERLACYDRALGRRAPEAVPVTPATTTSAPAAPAPATTPADELEGPGILARYWELDEDLKRGTFRFMTYKPNFLLPLHVTQRINRSPSSPTREAVSLPDYSHTEAKLQLSLRTKVAQSVILPGADIWFGYTQQSMWQVWNRAASAPFRNTDYEPELIYMVPVPRSLQRLPDGWRWRYAQVSLAHQSNGQAKPLSRSWNRVYAGVGLERGDVTVSARALNRLDETRSDDDNPDLTDYRGRGEIQVNWSPGLGTASLLYRSTFHRVKRGALQLDLTYPVDRGSPQGLRWYVQVFSGFGETLTDYNFRQTSFGVGLSLFEF